MRRSNNGKRIHSAQRIEAIRRAYYASVMKGGGVRPERGFYEQEARKRGSARGYIWEVCKGNRRAK